jgi:hypothetical protein
MGYPAAVNATAVSPWLSKSSQSGELISSVTTVDAPRGACLQSIVIVHSIQMTF